MQYTNRWTPPEHENLKLKVDTSVIDGVDSFSIGMVMRDHHGTFLQGRTMKFAGRVEVLEAEFVEIFEALKWCSAFGGYTICVESDSLLIVQAIKGKVQNPLEAEVMTEQCRFLFDR